MPHLITEDLHWCLKKMKKTIIDLLKAHPNQLFVAGGFIRSCISGDKINDIDIFAPSAEIAGNAARRLRHEEGRSIHESENAFTVRTRPVTTQFIHRWTFATPTECIQSFDFTVAKAAIWWDGTAWVSECDERFYCDLAAKRLVYCSPIREEEAGGSMLRVLKFYQRGYRIPMDSLAKVMARVGVRALDGLGDDAQEADVAREMEVLLREVDPSIDPEHQSHLPSTPQAQAVMQDLSATAFPEVQVQAYRAGSPLQVELNPNPAAIWGVRSSNG
jgi:hypothetical protein